MDAFSKFFQKGKFSLGNTIKGCNSDYKSRSEVSFGKDSVRLFVYRDHDLKGRKLLFDSKTICRIGDSQKSSCCRRKGKDGSSSGDSNTGQPPTDSKGNGKQTASIKDSSASSMIAEMMFGSVAMAYKGPTLKVHTIRTPPQVMVTKIFLPAQQPSRDSAPNEGEFDSCSYQSGSSVMTMDGSTPLSSIVGSGPCSAPAVIAHSVPVAVPIPPPPKSLDHLPVGDTGDSGIMDSGPSSHSSHNTPFPSPSSSSTSSSSYIHRRLRRNQNTSLEIHMKTKLSDGSVEKPLPASKRPPQIGIGIVFNMPEGQEDKAKHFQSFVFSHITLIEGHVNKMGFTIEKSLKMKHFQSATIEALEQFCESVFNLYLGPRLKEPAWLCMMTSTSKKGELCTSFLRELMCLVDKYNPKNKFVSCLLTGVLTQHLAWVPTVAPAGGTPSRTYLDKHSAKWLDALAKSHPYNPLWAQLSDLYGAIGFPLKLSRTVVVGKKQEIIKRFLYILSYFIRCSEVFEAVEEPDQCHLDTLEAQACTQEIMIPCAARDSKDGSVKSANSIFFQGSAMSCSNCGSVIENPCRGGQPRLHDSVTNSPNCETTSSNHAKWAAPKRTVRSPPPVPEENFFEFGQKRNLKSPLAVSEDKHCDINSKQAVQSPPPMKAPPLCNFETSKSFSEHSGGNKISGECQASFEALESQSILESVSCNKENSGVCDSDKICERNISDAGVVKEVQRGNVILGLPIISGLGDNFGNDFDRDAQKNNNTARVTEGEIDSMGEELDSVDMLQSPTESMVVDSEAKSQSRLRCPLLFTVVERDEFPELVEQTMTSEVHEIGSRPALSNVTDKTVESQTDVAGSSTMPSHEHANNAENAKPLDVLLLDIPHIEQEENLSGVTDTEEVSCEGRLRSTGAAGESGFTTESVLRTQSESALVGEPSKVSPSSHTPRHHSDSLYAATSTTREQKLCINGKFKYKIRNNLYPDLSSLKKEEGLQTPEDKPDIVFPINKTIEAKSLKRQEDIFNSVSERTINTDSKPISKLQRIKIGAFAEKSQFCDETVPVSQKDRTSQVIESQMEVKVQRVRHVGKQNTTENLPESEYNTCINPRVKYMSRDSGIDDSYERTTDTIQSKYLDSGVFDDLVFKTDDCKTDAAISKPVCPKRAHLVTKTDSKPNLVLRSFSSDSQNSFSDYGNVEVPKPEELTSLSHKRRHVTQPVLKRFLSEGSVSQFDEYFEEQTGEVQLFDETFEDTGSGENTISESVDNDRALSVNSGTTSDMDSTSCHTQHTENLPQEVDKSILFDRISEHPVAENYLIEALTTSLGSDDLDSERTKYNRSTLSWEEGVRRRDTYDDMCSSVTDSDITDMEGSLCSECTVKAERSGPRHRRTAYRRQSSGPSVGTPGRTSTPGRTRSVTPTELNRRRHASSLSGTTMQEHSDSSDGLTPSLTTLEHMIMPSFLPAEGAEKVVPLERNFGHSLLAGFSPQYMSDFTLHGTSDQNFHTRLHQDLTLAVQHPVLDENITEASCIVADTEKWNVKVLSCHYNNSDRVTTQEVAASKIICDIIDSVYNLWKLKMSPEFCLMHLEDRLQEVYFKSKMLSEYLRFHRKIDIKQLAAMLGFDQTDLPLLLAVAGTHTPYFALGLLS